MPDPAAARRMRTETARVGTARPRTAARLLAARLGAQLLGDPRPGRPEDVVQRLLAVQAQDARAFRLAVRCRSTGTTAADVDRALGERRTLVVSWLCRGTLHLVGADDYWWLHGLTAPRQLAGNATRLGQLGVTPAQADTAVDRILAEVAAGPRTRPELAAALDDAGLPTAGQAAVHLLAAASFRAHLVRGPLRDGEHAFVDAERWLGRPPGLPDRDEALARLARRYLAGHGPASPRDLAAFCGIPLGDARRGFAHLADELVAVAVVGARTFPGGPTSGARPRGGPADATVELADLAELADPADRAWPRRPPPPRLLGMFDPVLHGWADRSLVLGGYPGAVTSNGVFRATVLVDGRVAGTWTLPDGQVTLRTAGPLSGPVTAALRREAADVLRFLDLPAAPLRTADG